MPPIVIAAGIYAGAQIVGGLISSDATKSAAQTQANTAQQGLDVTTQEFNAQQQALQPYRGAAYGALGQLDSAFGIPAGGGYEAPVPIPGAVQPNGSVATPAPAASSGTGLNTPSPSVPSTPNALAGLGSPALSGGPVASTPSTPYGASVASQQSPNLSATTTAPSLTSSAPLSQPAGPTTGPTVRLRLPNGQTGTIPTNEMALINQYVAQGAQIIG